MEQPDDPSLQDPWTLVRLAMGSLAGESWRLKQALKEPSDAWTLRPPPAGSTWWDQFKRTQSFDEFKAALPFRPNTTTAIHVIVIGDEEELKRQLNLPDIFKHVEAFTGLKVKLLGDSDHPVPKLRLTAAGLRKSPDGRQQVGGHFVLAFVQSVVDPRAVCTLALTPVDLYPPVRYDYVTGMTDAADRLGLYSTARYSQAQAPQARKKDHDESRSDDGADQDVEEDEIERQDSHSSARPRRMMSEQDYAARQLALSKIFIKLIIRESLRLCGAKECELLSCLMNPVPEADSSQPEVVGLLPLSLCCICLRKLHWLTQADLMDRYAKLPPVLNGWFWEETQWLWNRMAQVGMPTSVCLSNPNPLGTKFKWGERQPKKSG